MKPIPLVSFILVTLSCLCLLVATALYIAELRQYAAGMGDDPAETAAPHMWVMMLGGALFMVGVAWHMVTRTRQANRAWRDQQGR